MSAEGKPLEAVSMTDFPKHITDIDKTVILTFHSAYRPPVTRFIEFATATEAEQFITHADGRVVQGGRGSYHAQVLSEAEVEQSEGLMLDIESLFLIPEAAR